MDVAVTDMAPLVTWLWQGLALALVVLAALRCLPRLSAATRHHVWWVALLAVLALPFVQARGQTEQPGPALPPELMVAVDPAVARGAAALVALPAPSSLAVAIGAGVWLGSVVLALRRLACSLMRVMRLKRTAAPVSDARSSRLALWSAARETGRPASLCLSQEVQVPCALGLGKAVILLPAPVVDALSDDELDQLVMHEYAHLVRRDDWWRLAQSLIEAIIGLHPAVRWIGRRIDLEREAACDDVVVALTGAVTPYAACLARVARLSIGQGPFAAGGVAIANPAVGAASVLRRRVTRLLDTRRNGATRPSLPWLALAGAALVAGLASLGRAAPVVEFVDSVLTLPSVPRSASIELATPIALGRQAETDGVRPVVARPVPRTSAVLRRGTVADELPLTVTSPLIAEDAPPVTEIPGRDAGVDPGFVGAPTVVPGSNLPLPTASDRSGWRVFGDAGVAIGDAGVAVGAGAMRSGTAVARFFARTGRAIGSSF